MSRINRFGQPVGDPLTVALPRPVPPHTEMSGQWSRLVPTDPKAHALALYAAFGSEADGGNWTYLPYGPFVSEAAFTDWLTATAAGNDPLFHTLLNSRDHPVGLASYLRIDPANGVIEVGHIHFAPRIQRTRLTTEAMYLMMARVFDDLGYRRYEWKCDALNAPSRAAAQRLGFRYEGTFRQATHYKGRNRDTAWFAMTDADWPAARAAFQAWLAPGNFDAAGSQKSPLRISPSS
jgi:RimJ/RimL family protein N-acetyltransferase